MLSEVFVCLQFASGPGPPSCFELLKAAIGADNQSEVSSERVSFVAYCLIDRQLAEIDKVGQRLELLAHTLLHIRFEVGDVFLIKLDSFLGMHLSWEGHGLVTINPPQLKLGFNKESGVSF